MFYKATHVSCFVSDMFCKATHVSYSVTHIFHKATYVSCFVTHMFCKVSHVSCFVMHMFCKVSHLSCFVTHMFCKEIQNCYQSLAQFFLMYYTVIQCIMSFFENFLGRKSSSGLKSAWILCLLCVFCGKTDKKYFTQLL